MKSTRPSATPLCPSRPHLYDRRCKGEPAPPPPPPPRLVQQAVTQRTRQITHSRSVMPYLASRRPTGKNMCFTQITPPTPPPRHTPSFIIDGSIGRRETCLHRHPPSTPGALRQPTGTLSPLTERHQIEMQMLRISDWNAAPPPPGSSSRLRSSLLRLVFNKPNHWEGLTFSSVPACGRCNFDGKSSGLILDSHVM